MTIGLFIGPSVLAIIVFDIHFKMPEIVSTIVPLIGLSSAGGYLLLPTHIYPNYSPMKIYDKAIYIYYAFIFITFGIGPPAMYFLKWKSVVKSKMKINGGPGL